MYFIRLWKFFSLQYSQKHTEILKNALSQCWLCSCKKLTDSTYMTSTGQWPTIPLLCQSVTLITVIRTRQPPSYLYSYRLRRLLPVENGAGCKLWLQSVFLDGGLHWVALTGYDHIRVCTWMKSVEWTHGLVGFGRVLWMWINSYKVTSAWNNPSYFHLANLTIWKTFEDGFVEPGGSCLALQLHHSFGIMFLQVHEVDLLGTPLILTGCNKFMVWSCILLLFFCSTLCYTVFCSIVSNLRQQVMLAHDWWDSPHWTCKRLISLSMCVYCKCR